MYYYLFVKHFSWDSNKNIKLKRERGVGFEEVIFQINSGDILDIINNPNQNKYSGQRVFILEINKYVYYVPFVENDKEIILKTIIPSRKLKKRYAGGNKK